MILSSLFIQCHAWQNKHQTVSILSQASSNA